jgi:U32 family peptidase
MRRRPEILAPVGSPDCLAAAVAGGADAVYLGLRHFNARGRAENFRRSDLARTVAYLHHHGLKCYVVMNTLLHDDEFAKAREMAAVIVAAAVDAVIVQDLGLWSLLGREYPTIERHASTQMTVHDQSQVEILGDLGAKRVILARELSLPEIARCTDAARARGIDTEHFVHGALCYAYSGQCLMSNFAGCRSANRGTCAQNCRFDYQTQEADHDTVISMKDLALIAQVPRLAEIGVASFKIEGRLKEAQYVYTTSRIYRAAADAWMACTTFDAALARDRLRDVFSRGHTDAWARGEFGDEARLHRYALEKDRAADATLLSVDRRAGRVDIRSEREPRPGQGYEFAHGLSNGGFLITAVDRAGDRWRCRVRIAERGPHLPVGTPLFRNSDQERRREAAEAMAAVDFDRFPSPTVGLDLTVEAAEGERLVIVAVAGDGRCATVHSERPLPRATTAAFDAALARDKLGALGGTGYHLGILTISVRGSPFIAAAELKQLRRKLVEAMPVEEAHEAAIPAEVAPLSAPLRRATRVRVAVGSVEAARAALAAGAEQAWLDDPLLDCWGTTAPVIDTAGFGGRLWLRHPATVAPSPHLAAIGLPVVAGHLGAIRAATRAGLLVTADVFTNVFNVEAIRALGSLGAGETVISLECSCRDLARLAARLTASDPAISVVVHGRIAAMLTRNEHGLAPGGSRAITAASHDGGLPYEIARRSGATTVIYEGRRLCGPEHVVATVGLVDGWVLELADLAPEAVESITAAYRALSEGRGDPEEVLRVAAPFAPHGFFPGHLQRGSRELDAMELTTEG